MQYCVADLFLDWKARKYALELIFGISGAPLHTEIFNSSHIVSYTQLQLSIQKTLLSEKFIVMNAGGFRSVVL